MMDFENITSDSLDQELFDIITGVKQDESPYDDTPIGDEIYSNPINPYAHPDTLQYVEPLSQMTRGIIVITGYPGSGKGVFMIFLAWMMRHLFGKKILLDYMPREAFDEFVYPYGNRYKLFDEQVLYGDFDKMKQIAKGQGLTNLSKTDLANLWATKEGTVRLKNAVLECDEGHKYFHRRRPFYRMNLALGGLIKVFRHLDLCLVVASPRRNELDVKTLLQYQTHEITMSALKFKPDTYRARVSRIRCISEDGLTESSGRAFFIDVNGKMPREYLNGKCWYDLYNTKNAQSI